jgi:hypothetical protein
VQKINVAVHNKAAVRERRGRDERHQHIGRVGRWIDRKIGKNNRNNLVREARDRDGTRGGTDHPGTAEDRMERGLEVFA